MSKYKVGDYVVRVTPGAGGLSAAYSPSSGVPIFTPEPLSSRLVVTGHSIPDNIFQWPWKGVIQDSGATASIVSQTGPYAGAGFRWDSDPAGPDAVHALLSAPAADYDLFLGTEAHGGGYAGWVDGDPSSVAAYIEFGDAYLYATQWHNLAASTGAQTFYSNFWRDDTSEVFGAPWRAQQNIEAPLWDGIIDYVNANRAGGTAPMRLVPWLQVFMAVYDAIQSGTVTGLTMSSIFADNVHVDSAVGKWLQMATVMAVMYKRHPNELPNSFSLEYDPNLTIDSTLASQLRPLVWETCLANPRSGLSLP